MKTADSHLAPSTSHSLAFVLLATLAILAAGVACSRNSKPAAKTPAPAGTRLLPASMEVKPPVVGSTLPVKASAPAPVKLPASKLLEYRSRNYGVSFQYLWQYALISARTIANGDASLRPIPDGHEGQFALVRVEIPKGFYSDTDYDSGYFTLSLNQELNEQQCESMLGPGNGAKVEAETINGVEFHRLTTESGGRGRAATTRQYVTYTNGTCYELELGVKTSNQDGLARELNHNQVFRRLEAILDTVKIVSAMQDAARTDDQKALQPTVAQD